MTNRSATKAKEHSRRGDSRVGDSSSDRTPEGSPNKTQ